MDVNYKLLKNGYILAPEDKLCIHGIEYRVKNDLGPLFYLENASYSGNDKIFGVLGIKDKYGYAELFGSRREDDGDFPFFRNLTDLTKCVISLYEEPEFKVGDLVYVLPRFSLEHTPVIYCDEMTRYSGSVHAVKHILSRSETMFCDGKDNGDPHSYSLDCCGYYWTTHMIRKATEEEIRDAKSGQVKSLEESDSGSGILKISQDTADRLKKEINDFTTKLKSCGPAMLYTPNTPDPIYPSWWEDTPSDTEVRLPKNEDSTPHIKL